MAWTERVDNSADETRPDLGHRIIHNVGHLRKLASIAWISPRSDESSLRRSAIFWTAEITVVWCLPPNARARSGYESFVWWRDRYIAIARGFARLLWRRSDLISAGLRP